MGEIQILQVEIINSRRNLNTELLFQMTRKMPIPQDQFESKKNIAIVFLKV
jgi:hypothetical protein